MIEVKNLTKKYGKNVAVDNLSFKIEKGSIFGFLGPNGAGKSTTMNIITGYLAPTEGTVLINGVDIQKEPEKAKANIGYLPEIPPLYIDMTVEEYLKFVAELKKVPLHKIPAAVEEVMGETHIEDMKKRLIRNLSKGYKQRVGMAQAMLGNPDVLIFDEPTVGLDPKQITEVRDLIKKLSENHTIILSSHILSEVSAVCNHIMIISGGKLVAIDTPEGLKKKMGGTTEILITVKDKAEEAITLAKKLKKVKDAVVEEDDESGNNRIRIISGPNVDIREEISLLLTKNGIIILGMEKMDKSLEDIFLKLTDDDNDKSDKNIKSANSVKKGHKK